MYSALLVILGCVTRAQVVVGGDWPGVLPAQVTAPVVVAHLGPQSAPTAPGVATPEPAGNAPPPPPIGPSSSAPASGAPSPAGGIEAGLDQQPATVLDPVRDGAFLRNDFVGNIRFGGGLIKTGPVALETRARLIELQPGGELEQQAVDWLAGLVGGVGPAPAATFRYARTRGVDPEDGHDNLNLPRTLLTPEHIDGSGSVLVPYVRAYYTHNGGWFLGQRWGCMAGARVDVLLVAWADGKPVGWAEVTGRSLDGHVAQATTAELDQHLLDAEGQVERALKRWF